MWNVDHGAVFYVAAAGIAVVGLLASWAIQSYARLFFREVRGQRRLITLAGAALVIIVIINMFAGVLTQPLPVLTAPPHLEEKANLKQ